MSPLYHRVLLIFLDGVGLAEEGGDNPFCTVSTPEIGALLGGPLTREREQSGDELVLSSLDARLGVAGLPQSATGQTALFAGVNAARHLGRHHSGFPGPRLRSLIERRGIFGRLARGGLEATFANAYSPDYLERIENGSAARISVTTFAVMSAGLEFRGLEDRARGEAVSWDIVGDHFGRLTGAPTEPVSPRAAGRQLAALASRHHFTLYESFITDLAGHRRAGFEPAEAVARVDGLLGGALEARDRQTTVVVTSDHGNLEESATRLHSLNPVPLLAVGPLAPRLLGLSSIVDLTPALMAALLEDSDGGSGRPGSKRPT